MEENDYPFCREGLERLVWRIILTREDFPMNKNPQELDQAISELRRHISFLESLKADRAEAHEELCRLGSIVENSDDAIIATDLDGLIVSWNEGAERIYGYSAEEVIGRSFSLLVPPDRQDEVQEVLDKVRRGERIGHFETVRVRKDGELIFVSRSVSPIRNVQGEITGISGIARDITARKRAEQALQQSQETIRGLLNAPTDMALMMILQNEGVIVTLNEVAAHILGGTVDELVGTCVYCLDRQTPLRKEMIDSVFTTGAQLRYEENLGEKYFDISIYPVNKADGTIDRVAVYASDVTHHKRTEEQIRRQNEFLNQVIESIPHPFYVIDAKDFTVKMANSAAIPSGLTAGVTCYALTHKNTAQCSTSDHACPLQIIKQTKEPTTVEHVHYREDGDPRYIEIHAYPVFDREGEVEQVIEYALDVTERKRMEEDLRLGAEKIKLFAYAISHDIRNPLIGVHGLTKLLARQYGHLLDEKGKKYCEQVVKASEKAVSLVEDINNFIKSKELPLHCEKLDLREIIRTIRSEFEPELSVRRIDWLEPPVLPEFCADRRAIERVFRNFVENALKYGGERLTQIDVEYRESEKFHIFCVTDDGAGIDGEDLDGVFNMFQRKDGSNRIEGTGMGLAIVKEIAEKHKGKAWAARGLNGGASFCVSISKELYVEPPAKEAA